MLSGPLRATEVPRLKKLKEEFAGQVTNEFVNPSCSGRSEMNSRVKCTTGSISL